MASSYKTFFADDIITTTTKLHESIPITGTIVSGTYLDNNITTSSNGNFQTVYDYPYLSASSNQLFDITVGYSSNCPASGSATSATVNKKKLNIYSQLSHMLVGHDATGSIYKFDKSGVPTSTDTKDHSLMFLSLSRLLVKDEIKKGSLSIQLNVTSGSVSGAKNITITDASGSTNYKTNSPVGEYGILYLTSATANTTASSIENKVGYVFYQAGVVGLSTSLFSVSGTQLPTTNLSALTGNVHGVLDSSSYGGVAAISGANKTIADVLVSGSIPSNADMLRSRVMNISLQNTTELNSSIYFCRVGNADFNYSSNPTYLSASQIRVKTQTTDAPVSYFTTVGLYSPKNELLAVAKLSQPLKKTPSDELLLKIRLDY
jgi:hypothetical protein